MTKNFKNMSVEQIRQLAEKNRQASRTEMDAEMKKRGITQSKTKTKYVHVDRSEDPKISQADHRTIFNAMKKLPYS